MSLISYTFILMCKQVSVKIQVTKRKFTVGLERIHWVGIHPEKAMYTNVNTIAIIDDKRYYRSNYAKDNVRKKRELRVYNGEGNGTPLQYSCLENPMDGGAWKPAVHGVTEGRTRLSNFSFTFHFHVLEKEMATDSSVLAWRIPGTGEPGGVLFMGLHGVGHD